MLAQRISSHKLFTFSESRYRTYRHNYIVKIIHVEIISPRVILFSYWPSATKIKFTDRFLPR